MRVVFVLVILLSGCASYAAQPQGNDVIRLLFENAELSLSSEPLCSMVDAQGQTLKFKEYLSQVLSVAYENTHQVSIKTFCSESKQELDNHKIIDIWDCRLEVLESNSNGDFISSSNIAMGVSKQTMQFIPGSLRCL